MASRCRLVHHPAASADYRAATDYFEAIDPGLVEIFTEDFQAALRGIASGKTASTLYAEGSAVRWVKLKRFSHKVFFEQEGEDIRFVLALISGKRHPTRIRLTLRKRRKTN